MLAAVHNLGIDIAGVRAPGNVGDVPFLGEILHIQPYGGAGGEIIDPNGHLFGSHPVHGVLDLREGSGAGVDVQQRELGHHGLVFPVESHFGTVRRHIPAGIDAEFVSAYRFPENQIGTVGRGDDKTLFPCVVPGKKAAPVREEGIAGLGALGHPFVDGAIGLQ